MPFELATAISCDPGGCRVTLVDSGETIDARYSPRAQGRVMVHPGQLVLLDMQPAIPEIAWRWHRMTVIDPGERQVLLQGHKQQVSAARLPGLELDLHPGDEVWVIGTGPDCEIHEKVVDGRPSDPARLREKILPRIFTMLANLPPVTR